jgi:hypothetical protein
MHLELFEYCFVQCKDACGHLSISSIQICIVALWMLTYGITIDAINEYGCLA